MLSSLENLNPHQTPEVFKIGKERGDIWEHDVCTIRGCGHALMVVTVGEIGYTLECTHKWRHTFFKIHEDTKEGFIIRIYGKELVKRPPDRWDTSTTLWAQRSLKLEDLK